jgi:RNA polymerase sigma factor (sigma-70 family)
MMAVVLGTALSAFGPGPSALAQTDATDTAIRDISRYCTTCWRNARLDPGCWTDCTQEVFGRLLERVAPDAWGRLLLEEGEDRREFLRAIDAVKKRTQRQRRLAGLVEEVADGRRQQQERLAEDRELVRQAAEEVLSDRQQRILQLSLEGWPVPDIARELNTSTERISDEKYKAVRKLRAYLGAAVDETDGSQEPLPLPA